MEDTPVELFLDKIDEMIISEMAEDESEDAYDTGMVEGYKGGLKTAKQLFMDIFQIVEVTDEV